MSSDAIDLVIEEGRKIMCRARGRPAVVLGMAVGLGIVIIAREIYLKGQRSDTRIKKS